MNNKNVEKLYPTQLFFLTYMLQVTVAFFQLPRKISVAFGTNSWIILLVFGAIVTINIYLFQLVYQKGNGASVFDIINATLPKIVRIPIYIGFTLCWSLAAISIAKRYIFIIQLHSFPTTPSYYLLVVLMLVVILFLQHPVYKMVRISGVLFVLSCMVIVLTVFLWNDFSWSRLTPFILEDTASSANWLVRFDQYLPLTGFEVCLFLFPYVTKDSHLFRSFYLGNAFTTFVYVYVVLLSYGFYSFQQIKHVLYPTLQLFSFIEFPFFIRIENLVYNIFLMQTIVTVAFYYWISGLALKQVVKMRSKLYLTLCIIVFSIVVTVPFTTTQQELGILLINNIRFIGVLSFVLPLFLLLLIHIKKKVNQ